MTCYVALLRAVNVGGIGKLPMRQLRAICDDAGFLRARTYIASGNVVFEDERTEAAVRFAIEQRLSAAVGRQQSVFVRSADELAQVLANNPFATAPPARVVAVFLDRPPAADALDRISGRSDEQVVLGRREIYVYYPLGIGVSRLKVADAAPGTARNMNTIAKLVEMAATA